VPRPREIAVKAFDRTGRKTEFRAEGFAATALQHEYDHLEGILFIDRMRDLKTLSFMKEFDRYVLNA
jgi:peptide deformylase